MCGVIGIIDREKPVFERAFLAIKSLQNRGEDACGIATASNSSIFLKKDLDSADNVFTGRDSKCLKGSMAVCHNRYATQGKENINDAQPICTPNIAFALNGNAVNYFSLKKSMKRRGVKLNTTVDTEVMLNIFAREYRKKEDFFLAARKMMRKVRGGYAVAGMIAGKGIFGIRDPHGIRPLALGKKEGSYILASETNALDSLGYKFVREIKPGEAFFISKNLKTKSKVLRKRKKTSCMFEAVYFSNEGSRINNNLIRDIRRETGKLLAEKFREGEIDAVVPVPDTGKPSAMGLASALGVPYREALVRNKSVKRTFILPSSRIRQDAVKSKFSVKKGGVNGKRIALVDDSLVRGTTAKTLVSMMRQAGASKVVFVSACPKVRHPCFYGINMSTRKELVGSRRTTNGVRSIIGADRLVYLPLKALKKALGGDICTACLDRSYPVKVSIYERMVLAHQRAMQDRDYTSRYAGVMEKLGSINTKIKGMRHISWLKKYKIEKIPYIRFLYRFAKKRK